MIIVVFGKPGSGKTALLTSVAASFLNGSIVSNDYFDNCVAEVQALNAEGFNYILPAHAPVYSNYPITVQSGVDRYTGSYYIDGFHLGFENDNVETISVLPNSKIFLAEAQRYYNSRRSKDLPDWVSRFYEEHRHYGLDIYLDVQRPGLIDVNIRELVEQFIEVESFHQSLDEYGHIACTDFYCKVFTDWKFVEQYLAGNNDCFDKQIFSFDFNVFECYESKSYYRNFLPVNGFDYINHVSLEEVEKDVELAKLMYRQTPPIGFYSESKGKK